MCVVQPPSRSVSDASFCLDWNREERHHWSYRVIMRLQRVPVPQLGCASTCRITHWTAILYMVISRLAKRTDSCDLMHHVRLFW